MEKEKGKKIAIKDLVIDKSFFERFQLNDDAIERYCEMYKNKETKKIKIQKGTNKIIDGVHRYHAAIKAGVKSIYADALDVPDADLRGLAYQFNVKHGIPYSIAERNQLITNLCLKDGKTESQIAKIVGLSQQEVSKILTIQLGSNSDTPSADKRRKLTPQDILAILKLLIGGESQEEISHKFGVDQSTISKIWREKRDEIKDQYESGNLKKEVAEEFGLTCQEVDKVLQEYGDPINFEPIYTSFWPAFGIDKRYGQKHKGNIPAGLVQNILFFYSKSGDVVLDPFAGGGVVEDVCNDMVNRKCYSYDYNPKPEKVGEHNIRDGPPECDEISNLIFLDPPYGPQKKGQYSKSKEDLANLPVPKFLDEMEKIFGYWEKGRLVLLMGGLRKKGEYTDLPFECLKRMEKQNWQIIQRIVNEIGHPESDKDWKKKRKELGFPLRGHIDIIIGDKR